MSPTALIARDLVRVRGTRRVLDGVSLTAAPGQRIGLIGENGTGKTTLLRILAGVDEPESGTVARPPDVGFLHQQMHFEPTATIAAMLDDALRPAREDLAELDRLGTALASSVEGTGGHARLLTAYGDALERARERDAWDADRHALTVLAGLGLGAVPQHRTLATLSGGQRGRLALAAVLVRRPAALLLDEPTNHLDDEAAAFCEEYLRGMPGVVVAASHDRAFLDAACTDLLDLDPAVDGPIRYGGSYSAYVALKRAEAQRWRRRHEEEQAQLAELRVAVGATSRQVAHDRLPTDGEKMGYGHRSGRVQNQVSRRVRDATRRLDALERKQIPAPPAPLRFRPRALATGDGDEVVVSLNQVEVPDRLRLDRLDILAADRLLVSGPNGAGKSTLLAVLAGTLPTSGSVRVKPGLRIAVLSQDTNFAEPERTARQIFDRAVGPDRADEIPLSSLGLLGPTELDKPVGELSLGQHRRLALALLLVDPPDLLLLDEPTNHLSPRLSDELEDALTTGPGAVVVASHDRRLRSRWTGREVTLKPAASQGSADKTAGLAQPG